MLFRLKKTSWKRRIISQMNRLNRLSVHIWWLDQLGKRYCVVPRLSPCRHQTGATLCSPMPTMLHWLQI
jgi:hypothetical protein